MAGSLICPKCRTANRLGAKFCIKCGSDLSSYDPSAPVKATPAGAPPDKAESGGLTSVLNKLLGRVTQPLSQPAAENTLAQPESLSGGYLYPSAVYRRDRDKVVGQHAAYFVAQNEQHRYFLIREVRAPLADAKVAQTLVKLSTDLPNVQRLVDVVHTPDGHTYLVLAHPTSEWYVLPDSHEPFPERAIDWGTQIGQALDGLHRSGYALGEHQQAGLEKILIEGNAAKLADLSTCVPLPTEEAQKRQAILDDTFFLARMLYSIATGHNLTKDLADLKKLDRLPRPLRVAISLGIKGAYVSMPEMLVHLAGRNLPPLRLVSGKATHPGRARDHNEDQYFVYEVSKGRSDQPLPAFYMVADGMGGHEAGEVASDTISAALRDWLDEYSSRKSGRATRKLGELPDEALKTAIREANAAVFRQARARKSNMGATVTAALVVGEQALIANVGDSRTYLFRQGELKRITSDHSLVFSLASAGQIGWDEIYTHPQRNQIFRSLGDKANIEVDVFPVGLESGDVLLLCSDGLWEMVRDPHIAEILKSARDPQDACDRLIDAANRGGGEDNITAVVVKAE